MPTTREVLLIQTFRNEPGDLGIPDRPALPDVEDALEGTRLHLESYLKQPKLGRRSPLVARLVGMDGRVIAEFRLTPNGAERVSGSGMPEARR